MRMLLLLIAYLFLSACASSNVSREASSNVDMGVQNAKNLGDQLGEHDIADAYQNSTQTTKGALLGGAAGATVGALYTGSIGVIPGAAAGIIAGAAYGSYIDANTTLRDRLENRGVNVVMLGDQILIVIPSARIFDPMTASIKPQSYSTFDMIAQYINQYTKMLVKVAVYTGSGSNEEVNTALSKDEADCIAKALLASGVDARVLYAEGAGSTHFVTADTSNWDSDNYRIEITLEKLYV
ncbi:MAG: hypothetical protein EPO11_02895 [Gammaproteobacteria bacterium]|nr:MAG: hypothetical protein EPO11_02895 [Gammaproteobacteria bacterium]